MQRTVKLCIAFTILFLSFSFSQGKAIEKTIEFSGFYKKQIIKIDVDKNAKTLDINIKCEIDKGFSSIIILNPNQKEKERFVVQYDATNKELGAFDVRNYITKKIKKPNGEIAILKIKDTILPSEKINIVNGEINKKINLPKEGVWEIIVSAGAGGKGKITTKSKTNY